MEVKKRLFQVLDEMNVHDIENNSALIGICPDFISADTFKGGCKITMGAPLGTVNEIMNGKYMPVLLLIDKEEYFKRNPKK
jgi:hypothetical protein